MFTYDLISCSTRFELSSNYHSQSIRQLPRESSEVRVQQRGSKWNSEWNGKQRTRDEARGARHEVRGQLADSGAEAPHDGIELHLQVYASSSVLYILVSM